MKLCWAYPINDAVVILRNYVQCLRFEVNHNLCYTLQVHFELNGTPDRRNISCICRTWLLLSSEEMSLHLTTGMLTWLLN